MSKTNHKPVATVLGAAIAGLALSGSAFAVQPLAQGYMAGATAAGHGHGGDAAHDDGEGKCGIEQMDTDKDGRLSQSEFAAAHDGDTSRFAAHDPDGDGFISAEEMAAHHAAQHDPAAKAGEGKCGEGKCGEGKCGGAM